MGTKAQALFPDIIFGVVFYCLYKKMPHLITQVLLMAASLLLESSSVHTAAGDSATESQV